MKSAVLNSEKNVVKHFSHKS